MSDIDSRRYYPQAHPEDLSLAQAAIQTAIGRGIQRLNTAADYLAALRRLANHLGAVGMRIAALDHDALVNYVKQFFASDRHMRFALPWLRHHREPGAPPPLRRLLPSEDDEMLIDEAIKQAARRRRWEPKTAEDYARVLRRLSQDLASRGQTIAAFDHNALAAHAMQTVPDFEKTKIGPALTALREYRQPLEDLTSESPPRFAAAKRLKVADHLGPLPGASWNTANFCQGVPSARSRADSANQPSSLALGEFEASNSNPPHHPAYEPTPLLSPSPYVSLKWTPILGPLA
ncbi:hypothetical protein CWO90_42230 [Bradyrhizobium sp. Leo121]|nr:hypothetical protein CWO90_42230 [Bradyrhizobium sp. Leo121]